MRGGGEGDGSVHGEATRIGSWRAESLDNALDVGNREHCDPKEATNSSSNTVSIPVNQKNVLFDIFKMYF